MNIKNRKKNDQVLPLNMFKKVCRFRMFSVSHHAQYWPPPMTCRGSCSPSVGLSPHPERTSERLAATGQGPARFTPRKKATTSRSSMPEIPSLNPDSPSPNLWMLINMLMFTAVTKENQPGRFAKADQGSVSAKCENSRRPSGSFRSRSRDNLCSC